MIRYCLISACLMLLSACCHDQLIQIPEIAITPCASPVMEGDTVGDLFNLAIDQQAAIDCYRAKQDALRGLQ
ncbi:Rz1-like lysis system protein LysC [Pseudomonas segetis]